MYNSDCVLLYIAVKSVLLRLRHGRLHIGEMGSADPRGKMDEKLKSENMQKADF